MRRLLPALLTLTALTLTGCVADDATFLADSARATVERLRGMPDDEQTAAALGLAAATESRIRVDWGIDEALGAATLDALLGTSTRPEASAAVVPASVRADGPSTLDSFIGIGFVTIGELGRNGMDLADRGEFGSDSTADDGVRADVTVTETGEVTSRYSTERSSNGTTASITAETRLSPCADADGSLELTGSASVRIGGRSASLELALDVTARATLDDDARYATREYEYRFRTAAAADGVGEFFDHSASSRGDLTVNRSSSRATLAFQQGAVDTAAALAEIVARDLFANAQRGFESGRCIDVRVTPSTDPTTLEPGGDVTLEVAPHSVLDRRPAGGSVVATLAGEGSLDRDGSRVPAVATYTYTGADEKDRAGTVTIETRSRRGVGTTTVDVGTGGRTYTATGSEGEVTATGTICSLTSTFTLTGDGLVFTFTPAGRDGGSFTVSGSHGGATFEGAGDYTVQDADASTATALQLDGEVTASAQGYSSSAPTRMTVALTPTASCR